MPKKKKGDSAFNWQHEHTGIAQPWSPHGVPAVLMVTFPAVNIGPVSSHLAFVYQHSP